MPQIYDRPAASLIADWTKATNLKPGQTFSKSDVVRWFAEHYPKLKRSTITTHVDFMSVNSPSRVWYSPVKPGGGCDLFYKLGPDQYRLWNKDTDGPPLYKTDIKVAPSTQEEDDAGSEFAYERDLQNYLAKNLHRIESGLRLYDEEEISGLEFSAGGRRIDILAVDGQDSYVVIELKVSRGYAWVEQEMEPSKPVRGIIVAKEITEDLKLAASRISNVRLIEYEIEFKLRPI